MDFKVKNIELAEQGKLKIEWAEAHMPVLMHLKKKYGQEKPLKGIRIAGCLHVTKETAVLIRTLRSAGAELTWCGCNPLSTQDDVAAALAKEGIKIFAWRENHKEYYWCIEKALEIKPMLTLDDGADLIFILHKKKKELLKNVIGGTEETTTGVHRLTAMAADGKLEYPIIAVNNAETKWDFDNYYGTGQSSIDGIIRSTNILLAGKNFVVCSYGHCGKGVAMRAKGMGASVIITEVDPVKALKARMDGFQVMPLADAARLGDIFVTATGNKNVIRAEHMEVMRDHAILANTGHFNVEISIPDLEKLSVSKKEIRPNNVEYTLSNGRHLHLLAEGRLVNLAAAEGHPSEVMGLSFANQFLSILKLAKEGKDMEPRVYDIPKEQDTEIARIKLETMGIKIDTLTPEQKEYLESWEEGT